MFPLAPQGPSTHETLLEFDTPATCSTRTAAMIVVTNNEGTSGIPVTARLVAEGATALDAVEAGIRIVEEDESVRTVGRGGWPNLLGEVELDASVMEAIAVNTIGGRG